MQDHELRELDPPDLSTHREGNTDTPYVHLFASDVPGPTVMINALVHGNEVCGAIVLDHLLRTKVRPKRGTLIVSFANMDAYKRFNPTQPDANRYVDEDMNRVFGRLHDPEASPTSELKRARELRSFIDAADCVLDIHSMSRRSPPLVLTGKTQKALHFASDLGVVSYAVADVGHEAGLRMMDYDGFAVESNPKVCLVLECGWHWARSSLEVAERSVLALLRNLELLDQSSTEPAPDQRHKMRLITVTDRVTIRTDRFRFTKAVVGLEIVEKPGTEFARDGDQSIRTPYDQCILVMPARRLDVGTTAVRLGRFAT